MKQETLLPLPSNTSLAKEPEGSPRTNARSAAPQSGLSMSRSPSISSPMPTLPTVSRRSTVVSVEGILESPAADEAEEFSPGHRQAWFPQSHILRVELSEPRDVLQSERTFLGFIRFALSLFFTAIGLILGFHLRSDTPENGDNGGGPKPRRFSLFNKVVSFLLVFLAFSTLTVAGVNYFMSVRRYSQRKIQTQGSNSMVSVVCVSAVVVTLAGLNVSLIVERYIQDR
ncbi:hypothetical protein JCM33374_g1462 [Metschnikowia sp. JCM 33374]|nr:hypothetical protein JCM33374_g1462 [Metschnikowia sp. JCM 33374]